MTCRTVDVIKSFPLFILLENPYFFNYYNIFYANELLSLICSPCLQVKQHYVASSCYKSSREASTWQGACSRYFSSLNCLQSRPSSAMSISELSHNFLCLLLNLNLQGVFHQPTQRSRNRHLPKEPRQLPGRLLLLRLHKLVIRLLLSATVQANVRINICFFVVYNIY